ncbi:MAG: CAP domain-containing protein [Spirochaetes bacterium]|nr:CAP domain-containing protein [Spirochaetota bacterium]
MKKITILLLIILPVFLFSSALKANTTRDIGKEPRLNRKIIADWIILYTNIERIKNGLSPLEYDEALASAAFWQADYCAKIKNLDHISRIKGMETPKDRIENYDRKCGFCGENLAAILSMNIEGKKAYVKEDKEGTYYDFGNHTICWRNEKQVASTIVRNWMNSKYHRDNILNPGFLWIGAETVSGILGKNKSYYGCQVFNGYGGLNTESIKIKYNLSGLNADKGTIEGKDAYLFSYKGNLEPSVFEITENQEIIKHSIIKKDERFIFIKNRRISNDLFAALFDKRNQMLYPVLLLK